MKLQGVFELPASRISVEVPEGATITEAADRAGIVLNTSCAQQGTCGGCAVDLVEGVFQNGEGLFEISASRPRRVLGCQTRIVRGDWRIIVPRRSLVEVGEKIVADYRMERPMKLQPSVRKFYLELPPATIEDPLGDSERIERAVKSHVSCEASIQFSLDVLRKLPGLLDRTGYRVTVTVAYHQGRCRIIDIEPGDTSNSLYGVAVDVGTTTVVCALVNLVTGEVVDRASCYNQQVQRADDVASRIVYAGQPDGLEDLRRLVVDGTVNRLVRLMCHSHDVDVERVGRMVISGNTIMSHLFLGLDPRNIGGIPFQPVSASPGTYNARTVGVAINPAGLVDIVPSISGYVGGDITSDIYVSGMDTLRQKALLVDLGTNGEIAVCHNGKILASATAAGPAFEGGRIRCGMRASTGAVEHIRIDPQTMQARCEIIGGTAATGICGSGLIDLIAEAFRIGLMDSAGRFDRSRLGRSDRLRVVNGVLEYVVVPREQTEDQHADIAVDERDVANLLQAKAATYAGITILLQCAGLSAGDLDVVYLAGGFAAHVGLSSAIAIGLLPDLPASRYRVLGNGSLAGAVVGLLDREAWQEFRRISVTPKTIELNRVPEFQDEFVNAMFIPNVREDRFPSVCSVQG